MHKQRPTVFLAGKEVITSGPQDYTFQHPHTHFWLLPRLLLLPLLESIISWTACDAE